MDLTRFTQEKTNTKIKKETIIDNSNIKITKIDKEIEITINNSETLNKFQDFLFFAPTEAKIINSKEEAQKFFNASIEDGVEGVMFKSLTSGYSPGLRTGAMAKLKETKEDIDVAIVAAEYGKGKRAGYYSSFFVAVKNDDYLDEDDKYLKIGKVSSGIQELGEDGHSMTNLTKLLDKLKTHEENNIVYFEPKIILQVRYQEIQKSTTYASGYALRFPRIISLREDKSLEEINSITDIEHFI